MLRDGAWIGVICFPFLAAPLSRAGVPEEKLRTSFPVVDVQRFLDRSSNGDGVMSVGAALAKKRYSDFIDLAAGFLCKSMSEIREIVAKPFPEERREAGFELAPRSDIRKHVAVLTELWESTIRPLAR
jgi:hypothetical protein